MSNTGKRRGGFFGGRSLSATKQRGDLAMVPDIQTEVVSTTPHNKAPGSPQRG